ncbi:MAG: DUF5666 domain-containing protein [Anaerolineales bacterium]
MKKMSRVLLFVLALTAMLVGAYGGVASAASAGTGKGQASLMEFTGVIEAIDGNQWTIGGQVITIDPTVLHNGPYKVGDTVKVEADVQADGSILITSVELPSIASDLFSASALSDPINGVLVFDNSGTEVFGTVDSITTDTVVIGGLLFEIANGAEFKNQIKSGDFVKVHVSLNADGTMSITEIEAWDPALVNEDNSNSKSNVDANLDDNGAISNENNDVDSIDDNSNGYSHNDEDDNEDDSISGSKEDDAGSSGDGNYNSKPGGG